MDFSSIIDLFQNFETSRIIAYLESLNLRELSHNPWVLGSLGALALLALIMRWRVLLATILSVVGFVGLINYTLQQETSLDSIGSQSLAVFVVGGVCIIFVVIYLLFIKSD